MSRSLVDAQRLVPGVYRWLPESSYSTVELVLLLHVTR